MQVSTYIENRLHYLRFNEIHQTNDYLRYAATATYRSKVLRE